MTSVRLSLPTVLVLLALVGAGAFAAGQAVSSDASSSHPRESVRTDPAEMPEQPADPDETDNLLPPGHPPTQGGGAGIETLPPGHPPIDSMNPALVAGARLATSDAAVGGQTKLHWQAPARWQPAPNASPMRLATYRVPRAPGDSEDAELSITQAGGSVDANAERWIAQFDTAGQKTAKRATRWVGPLEVNIVEAQGTYSGGMGREAGPRAGQALLGAIVSTPGMPHFFKLTGPAKTVLAAKGEFDALVASFSE